MLAAMTLTELSVIAAIYIATIMSPGPSTLAIAATAMASGRRLAIPLAAGVLTGSISWSLMAAFGMSALMMTHAWVLEAVRYAGACYLLWLALRSARSAMRREAPPARAFSGSDLGKAYLRGVAMHLTNPKAILFWGSLFAIAVKPEASPLQLLEIVAMTSLIGGAVFLGYAVLFSTGRAMRIYARARRGLEAAFAGVFAAAGIALLTGRLAQ